MNKYAGLRRAYAPEFEKDAALVSSLLFGAMAIPSIIGAIRSGGKAIASGRQGDWKGVGKHGLMAAGEGAMGLLGAGMLGKGLTLGGKALLGGRQASHAMRAAGTAAKAGKMPLAQKIMHGVTQSPGTGGQYLGNRLRQRMARGLGSRSSLGLSRGIRNVGQGLEGVYSGAASRLGRHGGKIIGGAGWLGLPASMMTGGAPQQPQPRRPYGGMGMTGNPYARRGGLHFGGRYA